MSAIFLLNALFIFTTQSSFSSPVIIDRLEASVNSSLILFSDVRKFRDVVKLRSQIDPLFAGTQVAEKGSKATNGEIVEFLINERLISLQFPVSDTEVEQAINAIQHSNRIDRTSLKNALSEQGFSFRDYFELIRASASKRNLIDRDISTKVAITEDDIKNHYYNHFSRTSAAPVAYHLKIIFISIRSYKTVAATQEVAQRALKQLKNGESFEEVSKRFSDHPAAQTGGDLGTVTEDQMSPLIREQAKKIQIGQVSSVFGGPSSAGFYILKLLDMRSNDTERYEKVKDEIRNQLMAAEYQHQIALWLDRQRQTAFIHRAGEAPLAGIKSSAIQ